MKEHILLEKSFVYDSPERSLTPDNCHYDRESGFWRMDKTEEVMMISDYAEKPETKKCDVETGEDQKGE